MVRSRSGLDLKLLMLFGSYADGTFRMDSDVDVLVVASSLPGGRGESPTGSIQVPGQAADLPLHA